MLSFLQNRLSNCYDYCASTHIMNNGFFKQIYHYFIGNNEPIEQIAKLPREIQYEIAKQLKKNLQLGVNKAINLSAEKSYINELVALLNKKKHQYSEANFLTSENIDQFYQEQETQFDSKKGIINDLKDEPIDIIVSYFLGCDHFATLPNGKAPAKLLERQIAINKLDESIEAVRQNPHRNINNYL